MNNFEPPKTTLPEVWKRIPSFPNYDINWLGEVREHDSLRMIDPVNGGRVYIRVRNRAGKLITKRIKDLRDQAFRIEIMSRDLFLQRPPLLQD
jgi:hypothetical protein